MVTPSSFNRRSGPTRAERAWLPIRPPTYPRRAVALRCSEPDPWRHLPIRRGRVSMRHAHPHPPPISRMARLLAHLLRRCSGRDDCKASATPSTPTMGMELRILSRQSPLECTNCTTATFDQARAHFERAWRVFLSNRTKADLQASKTRAPTSPDFQSQISTHRSCGNQNGRRHSRLRPTGLNIN